jgi:anti-sigma factor ChrR (cupin superfamily)
MEINADFGSRAVMHASRMPWIASPTPEVKRRMLDRLGGEVARATSIVSYAPGSRFPAHSHGGGEEFLVLDGIFSDETGDFPAGTYIRNPIGTRHTPGSGPGCILFVKLWQFDAADTVPACIDTRKPKFSPVAGRSGVEAAPLHHYGTEQVRLEHWAPGSEIELPLPKGGEFLVLEGSFAEAGEQFEAHSWLRHPAGAAVRATAGPEGCRVWCKTGHLAEPISAPDAR